MKSILKLLSSSMVIILLLTVSSCSKKDKNPSPASSYPRKISVEYRVTSPSGLTMLYSIVRRNASGATELYSNQSLPYSYKFDMTANQYDALLISGTSYTGGTIDCEIFVDGKSVAKKTGSGNTLTDISATYVFQ